MDKTSPDFFEGTLGASDLLEKGSSMDRLSPTSVHTQTRHQHGKRAMALQGAIVVPIALVDRDPDQPRRDWRSDWQLDPKDATYKEMNEGYKRLDELTASIVEFGIIQPLLVRPHAEKQGHYIVIAGGRRLVAARRAGLTEIPVVVRDEELGRIRALQLIENLQRQQLHPMDEARAFQELMELEDLTTGGVAARVHVSIQTVRDRLRLLRDQVLADAVERQQIAVSVAREINKLPDEAAEELRRRVQAGDKLQLPDIQAMREQLRAAGITNPRRNPRPSDMAPQELAPLDNNRETTGETGTAPQEAQPSNHEARPQRTEKAPWLPQVTAPLEYHPSLRAEPKAMPSSHTGSSHIGLRSATTGQRTTESDERLSGIAQSQQWTQAPVVHPRGGEVLPNHSSVNTATRAIPSADSLGELASRLSWDDLELLLDYGIEQGWTCIGLKQAVMLALRDAG